MTQLIELPSPSESWMLLLTSCCVNVFRPKNVNLN